MMSGIDELTSLYSKHGLRPTAVASPGSLLVSQDLHFNKIPLLCMPIKV